MLLASFQQNRESSERRVDHLNLLLQIRDAPAEATSRRARLVLRVFLISLLMQQEHQAADSFPPGHAQAGNPLACKRRRQRLAHGTQRPDASTPGRRIGQPQAAQGQSQARQWHPRRPQGPTAAMSRIAQQPATQELKGGSEQMQQKGLGQRRQC
jgi:hypothetical protein